MSQTREHSELFTPLKIGNGRVELKHRVVLAPLTRNRGLPCKDLQGRQCYPDDLVAECYEQRATDGGLLITEGIAPNLQGGGMPGTTGLFTDEQVAGWKKVVKRVHAKGGVIYAQLWHQGRTTISPLTGLDAVSPSGLSWDDPDELHPYPITTGARNSDGQRVKFSDYPPVEMSIDMIKSTIGDFCQAARRAVNECGFDGIEVHGGNGYIVEQFLSNNVNRRTDSYGGTAEKRAEFGIELMEGLAKLVGQDRVAIRLSPFGLYNQIRGTERVETWSYLCRQLKSRIPKMSYVSFIEPRYEQIKSVGEKDAYLRAQGLENVDLSVFRDIFGSTPFFSAGGWNDQNCWGILETGDYDALVFGRWFISNPDLPRRLRDGTKLQPYERERFYGPFPDRERGYTDYPPCNEEKLAQSQRYQHQS